MSNPIDLLRVVEVGHEDPPGQLPRQRQRERHAVCNYRPDRKVLQRDLEPDACHKEDVHGPLEEPLELQYEPDVDVVVAAEDENGEEQGLGVVPHRHEGEEEEEEEAEARRPGESPLLMVRFKNM